MWHYGLYGKKNKIGLYRERMVEQKKVHSQLGLSLKLNFLLKFKLSPTELCVCIPLLFAVFRVLGTLDHDCP